MRGFYLSIVAGVMLALAARGQAKTAIALVDPMGGAPAAPAPGVLQCVPFARTTSGIRLYGDAHTWWRQAEGKYARGHAPRLGAVMAINPHGNSSLGHVATVSRIIDARTILISHANWSAPGKVERNVTAMDVSPANDWSEVRVWYAPIASLGGAHWPVAGFIYNTKPGEMSAAALMPKPGKGMASSTLTRFVPAKMAKVRFGSEPELASRQTARFTPTRLAAKRGPITITAVPPSPVARLTKLSLRRDPIGAIISRSH